METDPETNPGINLSQTVRPAYMARAELVFARPLLLSSLPPSPSLSPSPSPSRSTSNSSARSVVQVDDAVVGPRGGVGNQDRVGEMGREAKEGADVFIASAP